MSTALEESSIDYWREQFPESIAITNHIHLNCLKSNIEYYENCPGGEVALPAISHHWLIIQRDGYPRSALLESGGKEFCINSEKGLGLSRDHIIYIPPFTKTKWSFSRVDSCVDILIPDALFLECSQNDVDLAEIYSVRDQIGFHHPSLCEHVRSLIPDLRQKHTIAKLGLADYIQTTTEFFLSAISSNSPTQKNKSQLKNKLTNTHLAMLKEYMWENLSRAIQVDELGNLVHMSPFHFSRCFKKLTGKSPHQYLTALRVIKARTLLPEKRSLVEISIHCGFSDQAHFCRIFKKFRGFTPAHFRRMTA